MYPAGDRLPGCPVAARREGLRHFRGDIAEHTDGLTAGSEPADICAGPDGNLWFTENGPTGAGRVGRITPTGVITEFDLPGRPACYPEGITAGPDGALWFTDWSGHKIGRAVINGDPWYLAEGYTAGDFETWGLVQPSVRYHDQYGMPETWKPDSGCGPAAAPTAPGSSASERIQTAETKAQRPRCLFIPEHPPLCKGYFPLIPSPDIS